MCHFASSHAELKPLTFVSDFNLPPPPNPPLPEFARCNVLNVRKYLASCLAKSAVNPDKGDKGLHQVPPSYSSFPASHCVRMYMQS